MEGQEIVTQGSIVVLEIEMVESGEEDGPSALTMEVIVYYTWLLNM